MTIVSYDTETTGIPVWKKPSDSDEQPHLVQIGAVKFEPGTKNIIDTLEVIIKPDGWTIPQETIDIHGITNEYAAEVGIPEKEAVQQLLAFCEGSDRLAFNKVFDQRLVRIALKRFFDEEAQEQWAIKEDHHCSAQAAKKAMGLKTVPSLADAYKHFTGKEHVNAHSALADATASMTVYLAAIKAA